MSSKHKTIAEFEQVHGQPKIRTLQKRLAAEQAKVEALADVQGKVHVEHSDSCHIKFALMGDTQVGSLYTHMHAWAGFCDYAAKHRGVTTFFHTGDVLDGHRVYKGQEFELRDLGLDAQVERLRKDAPQVGTTKFITGNHDQSFKALAGIPVGKCITNVRPDYKFLGEEQGHVEWQTKNGPFRLMLIHPGGGTSYAVSYRAQKIIESLEGGTKPDMLAIGHYHKADMMPSYRNVCAVQTGTFQRQTPFMARQGLAAHVGGWIIDVTVGDGHNVIRGEFVAFYV